MSASAAPFGALSATDEPVLVPRLTLRDYQREAIDAILRHYAGGIQRQLISLPTGLGKSAVFSSLPTALEATRFDVTLVLAHVDELIEQAVDSFRDILPGAWIDKEKAEHYASPMAHVVVASIQTLKGKRLDEFFKRFGGRIKLLVIDEAHRSPAPSYRTVINRVFIDNPAALLVGVTATPRRSDNVGLDSVFDRIVYHIDIRAAIEMGYLVPMVGYRVATTTSLEAVKSLGGDYEIGALSRAVDTDARNRGILQAYQSHADNSLALVFAASVSHAQHLADLFCAAGYPASAVWGELGKEDRADRIARFRRGELRVLTSFSVLLEGFNVPNVECVILARPTKSGVLYTQALGRGLRPHDAVAHTLGTLPDAAARRADIAASAKPECIVLDVVDVTRRHSPITLPTIFGMPPSVDPKGRRISEVLEAFERLSEKDPEAAKTATTVEDMGVALEKVDLFSVPSIAADVGNLAGMIWREVREGVYRLLVPRHTTANDLDGNRIARFESRVQARLKQLASEDAAVFDLAVQSEEDRRARIYSELRVNPQSIRVREGSVEIRTDPLNRFEIWLVPARGAERKHAESDTKADAFTVAEALVKEHFGDVINRIDAGAPWRTAPITDKQQSMLKHLGCPKRHYPKTKGDASLLIDHLMDKQHKRESRSAHIAKVRFSMTPPKESIGVSESAVVFADYPELSIEDLV